MQFDETNDGDPYVCFRRRDIRVTRKTRRTDNFSVEQMQKLQTELRSAHKLAQMVVRRESEKKALYKAEREVWEAKWKLLETKRRWPSLGLTQLEEEIITGRTPGGGAQPPAGINLGTLAPNVLAQQGGNVPIRKKVPEKDREERERRERAAEAAKAAEKGAGMGRWFAPEELKARMQALRQKLEEEIQKKREADSQWDDMTDVSASARICCCSTCCFVGFLTSFSRLINPSPVRTPRTPSDLLRRSILSFPEAEIRTTRSRSGRLRSALDAVGAVLCGWTVIRPRSGSSGTPNHHLPSLYRPGFSPTASMADLPLGDQSRLTMSKRIRMTTTFGLLPPRGVG